MRGGTSFAICLVMTFSERTNMREIKFRVWNPKTKEYFIQFDGSNTTLALDYFENTPKVCYPEQFVGIKDKNGVDIYEGDRVFDGGSSIYTIEYSEKDCAYYLIGSDGDAEPMIDMCPEYYEVIGNSHT